MEGDSCKVLNGYRSNEARVLTIQAGQLVTLLENIVSNTTWVKCMDSKGKTGMVNAANLDTYKYEDPSDSDDGGAVSQEDNADNNNYENAYVPSEHRLFLCKKDYMGSDITVQEGELVVRVDDRQFKDPRGRIVRLVERRGVQKQQGTVPVDLLEGVPCLEQQRWFVGRATRRSAEEFLQHEPLKQTFLVRISPRTEGYVISIKEDGKYRHRKINRTATGQYTASEDATFNCVVELVYNHHRHRPRGLKLHHEYDKYSPSYVRLLNRQGSGNHGGELPPPDRSLNR